MTLLHPHERTFVALDTASLDRAVALAKTLAGHVGGVKVGKEFFTACGPDGVRAIADCGMPVFLDLKFHDIPNTVAAAVRAALPLRPYMINVHAAGGEEMMKVAAAAAAEAGDARPLVLGVTVLTSMDEGGLADVGVGSAMPEQVLRLASLAQKSGLDGVVCSAREAEDLRSNLGDDFKLVVPGIRPAWAAGDDQKRIVEPAAAVAAGADYLVVGRPITGAGDPLGAADGIAAEIAAGA